MSGRSLSLPSAERGVSLLVLLLALAFAPLAAASPGRLAYVLVAGVAVFVVLRSLIAGLALFVVLTFPDQLPGALGVGATLAKPLGVVILISWLLTIVGDRERAVPFLPRDAPVLTYTLLALLVWCFASMVWASDQKRGTRTARSTCPTRCAHLCHVFRGPQAKRSPDSRLGVPDRSFGDVGYALGNGTLRYGRLTGGIFNPNTLAAELVVAIVMAIFLLVSTRRLSFGLSVLPSSPSSPSSSSKLSRGRGFLRWGPRSRSPWSLPGPCGDASQR